MTLLYIHIAGIAVYMFLVYFLRGFLGSKPRLQDFIEGFLWEFSISAYLGALVRILINLKKEKKDGNKS
jgi:hypothetical protein